MRLLLRLVLPTLACLFLLPSVDALGQQGDVCDDATAVSVGGTVSGSTIGATLTFPGLENVSDCCYENGSAGCGEPSCEATVCAVDAYCCNTEWDGICVSEAEEFCGDVCVGNTAFCDTTHDAPERWYTVLGTGNMLTASTCNMANFDTKISVFCDDCEDPICIGGIDDTSGCGGFTTEFSWCSEAGAEYLVMVHGFAGAVGDFDLQVTEGGPCDAEPICPLIQEGDLSKTIVSGPDFGDDGNLPGDGQIDVVVPVNQRESTAYGFTITYLNPDGPDVLIEDTVPAEWDAELTDDDDGRASLVAANSNGHGPPGVSASKIDWYPSFEGGAISVHAETRNHRRNHNFRPSSCGALYLNDGAAAFELDPLTGEPLVDEDGERLDPILVSNQLCLAAVEDLDGDGLIVRNGSGDEDGDGLSDYEEACVLGTNPCDSDNDGVPNDEDCAPYDATIYPGAAELCNGVDDDCDDEVDEGFGTGETCEGVGECGAGTVECAGPSSTACSTDPGGSADQATDETCDGLDNDCDGAIDEGDVCVPTESEPNDSCAAANVVQFGDSLLASIAPTGDQDFFSINLTGGTLVEFETSGPSGDTAIQISGPDGTPLIGCDDDGGEILWSKWSCCLPPGNYCIGVKDWNNNTIIDLYSVDFRDLGSCTATEPLSCPFNDPYDQCNPF